ncbi:carbohydrate kinase [Aureimonas flava]|uniref:Carbohydrate kinase n=1 Tax=Aureimonas flava TaxID=2320271 RepID=A0A3A1WJ21_9HYPH|nr:FGGY family carbohydrate kinase [Aureimonas flava]RIX98483.1 carbohydrate kinase [Aureimonas flava]
MSTVAVFDVGKTNVKLFAATAQGAILEELSAPNRVVDGPPYRHHDLAALEDWLLAGLAELGRRHAIEAVVACSHGSGGVLVEADGAALPMIDYEQDPPSGLAGDYAAMAGPFRERGSAVMLGSAHLARQMLWLERGWPEVFARAKAFLALPQYWAFRLSGVLASEVTSLAAQSHLWSGADARPARLVAERGWGRLLPPLRPAFETLGPLRPAIARRCGLRPDTRVVCGIHDSSANFYRYQAAGLQDLTVVSTGTWIVALTDHAGVDLDRETPGLSCNADVRGRPVPGMLTMGGREFASVVGEHAGPATRDALRRIVGSGTMALPSFGADDGLFPGTARRGHVRGPLAGDPSVRFTLGLLYAAMLANRCLRALPPSRTVVLDGGLVRDPLFGAILAALNPTARVLVNRDAHGTATGAALIAGHEARRGPAPLAVEAPDVSGLPDLPSYWSRWCDLSHPWSHAS